MQVPQIKTHRRQEARSFRLPRRQGAAVLSPKWSLTGTAFPFRTAWSSPKGRRTQVPPSPRSLARVGGVRPPKSRPAGPERGDSPVPEGTAPLAAAPEEGATAKPAAARAPRNRRTHPRMPDPLRPGARSILPACAWVAVVCAPLCNVISKLIRKIVIIQVFHHTPVVSPDVLEEMYNCRKAGTGMTTGLRVARGFGWQKPFRSPEGEERSDADGTEELPLNDPERKR